MASRAARSAPNASSMSKNLPRRQLVITVCSREPGTVLLPVRRGMRPRRMDARTLARQLEALVATGRLERWVRVREGCAGGCWSPGPNVGVTIYPASGAEDRADHVAIGWRTYVYSLATLDCLSRIIDDNLLDRG